MDDGIKKSQTSMILKHLQTFGAITTYEAFEDYGCTRLSARIYDLRSKGYHILTEKRKRINRFGFPCNFANYKYLAEDGE